MYHERLHLNPYLCTKQNSTNMTQLEKYIWLIEKLKTFSTGLTLRELSDAWELKLGRKSKKKGETLDRQTLARWRKDISESLKISISSKRVHSGRYVYKLDNPEEIDGKSVESWVINSLSVFNTLNASRQLNDRIVCDSVPRGIEHLQSVMDAMAACCAMRLTVKSHSGSQFEVVAEPYALRQHSNRWYALCRVENYTSYQLYEFENILKVELLKDLKFTLPRNFNAEEYFSRFFGVTIMENVKPRSITIRARGKEAEQLRALPIHPTQEELPAEGTEYTDFRYFVAPTPDFMNYLLGLGSNVEVLKPEQCRFEMGLKVNTLCNRYFGWPVESDSSKVTLNGNFAAFDIKLANSESSGICSISVVVVQNGEIVRKFHSYVRPEPFVFDSCDDETITEETVREAQPFPEVWAQINDDIENLPLVSFFGLDAVILKEAFAFYGMENPETTHTFFNISEAVRPILGPEAPLMTFSTVAALSGIEVNENTSETDCAEFIASLALRYL